MTVPPNVVFVGGPFDGSEVPCVQLNMEGQPMDETDYLEVLSCDDGREASLATADWVHFYRRSVQSGENHFIFTGSMAAHLFR